VDTTKPTGSAEVDGPRRADGAYTGPVTVTLAGQDEEGGSGVASVEYALDGGDWTAYTTPLTVSARGAHTLHYRVTDGAGNVSDARSVAFTIVAPPDPDPDPDPDPPGSGPPPRGKPPVSHDPPPADPAARYHLARVAKRMALARFTGRGLKLRLTASEAARGTGRVIVSRKVARKLRLGRRVLAAGSFRFGDAGTRTLRLKPSRKVAKALRRGRGSVTATVDLRLVDGDGNIRRITRRIVLRR
jgi:hypothetical protein